MGICTFSFLSYGLGTVAAGDELEENLFPDEKIEQPVEQGDRFEVGREQINQWVFGNVEGRRQSGTNGIDRLNVLLSVRCESIASVVSLSEDQVSKLRLAGRGDIHRFMEKLDAVHLKFDSVRNDQEKMNQMWQEVQPLQKQFQAGLFGAGSLFNKVLSEILDEQQLYNVRTDEQKRQRFGYQARIWRALTHLERSTPLTKEQRDKLLELLLETPPHSSSGSMIIITSCGSCRKFPKRSSGLSSTSHNGKLFCCKDNRGVGWTRSLDATR